MSVPARLLRGLRRHGVGGLLRRELNRLQSRMFVHERHVWVALRLEDARPHPALPPGYDMFRGTALHVPSLAQLGVDVQQASERVAHGTELWLIRYGEDVVYAGWVFHDYAPAIAAPSGSVRLPARTVNPEDMVTSLAHQGRGLASAAYSRIFDDLQRDGRADRVLGKIPLDNVANRRAVQKAGWFEFAVVDFLRVGPWRHTTVSGLRSGDRELPAEAAEMTAWLTQAMRAAGR